MSSVPCITTAGVVSSTDNLNETVTLEKPVIPVTAGEAKDKKRPLPIDLANTKRQIADLNDSGIQIFSITCLLIHG